jgi:uncharacterized protein
VHFARNFLTFKEFLIMKNFQKITASHVYDYLACASKPNKDITGDPLLRDPVSEFTEMLWQNGIEHEDALIASLPITANIKSFPYNDREEQTILAMKRREPMIYSGIISTADHLGIPDLLVLKAGGYVPFDIKSGAAFELDPKGVEKYKREYVMTQAHYVNILEAMGFSDKSRTAGIIDKNGAEYIYDLNALKGVRNKISWFSDYQEVLTDLTASTTGIRVCKPAMSSACKLCPWQSECKKELVANNDLTLIAELGRAKRDVMEGIFPTLHDLANGNISLYIDEKKTAFPGVGPDSLRKYQERAILLSTPNAKPYLKSPLQLPQALKEIFWDIEDHPMQGNFVYLHGFIERMVKDKTSMSFKPVFADSKDDEEAAFKKSVTYLLDNIETSIVYHYSSYEKVTYRRLAKRYPDVCTPDEMDGLLNHPHMVDLYTDVVKSNAEFPCYDQSIKTLAVYLCFKWRDENPSGAASISWFNDFQKTGDVTIKSRIIDYNEDDCIATAHVLDALLQMPVKPTTIA